MLFSLLILVALVAFWAGLNPLTKYFDSRTRKFAFAGAILVFFFIMLFHRRGEVEAAAQTHDLQETNIGNVDLGGSTARFVLTSFRGPLVCAMWWDSEESKEHHEYHKLEMRYRQLTKLQPHFRSAWIYQGFNLAYNISVEFDRVEDKYFYIAEGVSWIAEGERINRARIYDPRQQPARRREVGDPDLRWHIGFMIQDKLSVSDEVNTHRCFFHLSCIPPSVWDASKLRRDPDALERFKKEYPQLTRQIRTLRNIPEGAEKQLNTEMLAFFTAHQRLPSLYVAEAAEGAPQAKLAREFPLWPDTMRPANPEREESHDPYDIAKCWFLYALEPLPPADYMERLDLRQLYFYRVPKNMVTLIFRKQPAQAKSLQAMALDKDGWFEQSQKAWNEALDMWRDYGQLFELDMPPAEHAAKEKLARSYYENFAEEARAGLPPPKIHQKNVQIMAAYHAFLEMHSLEQRRQKANYFHWRTASETNATDAAKIARKHLYDGHSHRTDAAVSLAEFEKGFAAWKPLLAVPRKFKPHSDDAAFLLGNTFQALPIAYLNQPMELLERTDFGKSAQAQTELGQYHDFYLILRAQNQATKLMHAMVAAWELPNLCSQQLAAPLVGCAGAYLPGGLKPLAPNQLESALLARASGPLDLYLHEEVFGRSSRRQSRQAAPELPTEAPRPPTAFQPTGAAK